MGPGWMWLAAYRRSRRGQWSTRRVFFHSAPNTSGRFGALSSETREEDTMREKLFQSTRKLDPMAVAFVLLAIFESIAWIALLTH
ncbi:MAG: hypothetical protein Tsb0020_47690 [Haliangiales bacterium]